MNPRHIVLLLAFFAMAHAAAACTTFCLRKGAHIVLGKNYDFYTGVGLVMVNKRDLQKTSYPAPDAAPISWISRYGSLTFNQFGKEFPCGGINEKGLVVESMWLDHTQYPAPDSRKGMFELQWIQYQLDNAASVAEVLASDTLARISRLSAPMHFLIADAGGNTATIEFIDGKAVVHTGADLKHCVLANNPYSESERFLNSISDQDEYSKTATNSSLDRFTKAAVMSKQLTTPPTTEYAFSILDGVAQGDFTRWSIVYDIERMSVHFKTQNNTIPREVSLTDFDFSCESPSLFHNIDEQLASEREFLVYSSEKNRETIAAAFGALDRVPEIQNFIPPKEERELLARYPDSVECRKELK